MPKFLTVERNKSSFTNCLILSSQLTTAHYQGKVFLLGGNILLGQTTLKPLSLSKPTGWTRKKCYQPLMTRFRTLYITGLFLFLDPTPQHSSGRRKKKLSSQNPRKRKKTGSRVERNGSVPRPLVSSTARRYLYRAERRSADLSTSIDFPLWPKK
jgi:hypothetical protein